MEQLIVALSTALTALLLAAIAIFLNTDVSSKIFVCKIRKLRKQNTALRRKCRKLKVSAEMPYYIIDLRGKIQEEEIKSLKLQLQSQGFYHKENYRTQNLYPTKRYHPNT